MKISHPCSHQQHAVSFPYTCNAMHTENHHCSDSQNNGCHHTCYQALIAAAQTHTTKAATKPQFYSSAEGVGEGRRRRRGEFVAARPFYVVTCDDRCVVVEKNGRWTTWLEEEKEIRRRYGGAQPVWAARISTSFELDVVTFDFAAFVWFVGWTNFNHIKYCWYCYFFPISKKDHLNQNLQICIQSRLDYLKHCMEIHLEYKYS